MLDTSSPPNRISDDDRDALHVLPLRALDLETRVLREARMIKNNSVRSVIELFSGNGIGSGQLNIEDLPGEFGWEIMDPPKDFLLLRQLALLPSFDVCSLRTSLRELGIKVNDMIADEPAMKAKINAAFTEAAKQVGIAEDNKEEMISLIAGLAEEFAYIEALRDQFDHLCVVETRIGQLADLYRHDHGVMETVTQVRKLCDGPMSRFRERFEEIDAQTGEIIAVIKNMAAQVKFIRDARDDLFRRFWAWNDIAAKWHDCPARRSRSCEALLAETYRFLAQRFLPQHEWALFTKAQETTKNRASESVWS
jgi:hypothetical protein